MDVEDLSAVTAVRRTGDGRFELEVARGWAQGRGAFGGLVLGALARAMEQTVGDPSWPLRSLTGQLPAPVLPGPAVITVEELRRGSATTTLSARLSQGGEVAAAATGVFGKQRLTDREWVSLPPPQLPDWTALPVLPVEPPFAPEFASYLEYRTDRYLPFSGGSEAAAEGFLRAKKASAGLGLAEIVALADGWWLAAFATEPAPRPMATVAFTFELCAPLTGLALAEPLFHRARTVAAHGGFCVELRELWDLRGRLIALNQQTIAFIR